MLQIDSSARLTKVVEKEHVISEGPRGYFRRGRVNGEGTYREIDFKNKLSTIEKSLTELVNSNKA